MGILDINIDIKKLSDEAMVDHVLQYLHNNYTKDKNCVIKAKVAKSGRVRLTATGTVYLNPEADELTDGTFYWSCVENFAIAKNHQLKDLTGSPRKVKGQFIIHDCNRLESLNGCAGRVDEFFMCINLPKLKDVKEMPIYAEMVAFNKCPVLNNVRGRLKECKCFYCVNLPNLTSLKGVRANISSELKVVTCEKLTDYASDFKGAYEFIKDRIL